MRVKLKTPSLLAKEIHVQALERKALRHGNAEVVLDHQRSQASAVDEDDFLVGLVALHRGASGGGEVAGGKEDAFLHTLDDQRANEVAHRAFAHRVLPALGLQIDGVQAQRVG
jgi:hypothetical protein